MTLRRSRSGTRRSAARKSKTGARSAETSAVRTLGHMPKILGRSGWRRPLERRKETTEWMEARVAEWRSGLRERALPESTPMTSRQRIFSLIWRERLEDWVWG
ncbi:hypothetical protein PanWU01x14_064690 [Parasponia andersonii]|uniref:Uncharacterized protein n=1 Tax=Parasponia andersonii TaxID=3476 RepID=A0A2P5DHG1_PARAD|nr:hypothetical protein PanWU01x14_064690 [Parasponia andersonii]